MGSGSRGAGTSSRPDLAEALDRDDPLLGRVLDGRYRVESVLGTGGVGVVYRATHTVLGRAVAVKVLHDHFGGNEDLRRRFRREAQALSQLSHPNIVSIADYGIADGMPYLTMELLEGRSLSGLLHERGTIEPELGLDIARAILRGLAFAHARGVVHRDLKPGNVFLQNLPDDPYHVKLLDFGLAKIVSSDDPDQEPTLTGVGTILGTPTYMSPEQASGARADLRSDVYSAGVLLFELLCGRPPFVAESRPEVMRAHIVEPIPKPSSVRPGLEVTDEVAELLRRALAKEPGERFADGGAMWKALDALPRPAARVVATVVMPAHAQLGSRSSDMPTALPGQLVADGEPPPPAIPRTVVGPSRLRAALPFVVAGVVLGLILLGVAAAALLGRRTTTAEGAAGAPTVAGASPVVSGGAHANPEPRGADSPAPGREGAAEGERPGADPGAPQGLSSAEGESVATSVAAGAAAGGGDPGDGIASTRPPARNPFARGVPRELRRYAAAVRRGRRLSRAHQRAIREYQRAHPEDPRPSLLLARDYVERAWFTDAVARYERAYDIDPSSRGTPRMCEDLVQVAKSADLRSRAADVVVRIYGPEAVDVVDRALARDRMTAAERERLQALRKRLGG